jgi:beta-aspartyl-peptidase (threonine type)
MEETDHAMLTGEGALRFARALGFADHDNITPARKADWERKRALLDAAHPGFRIRDAIKDQPEYAGGTVGAAAVDARGVLAAATSTGGVTLKLVGRVGDSPIPGAGNYATEWLAASATGTGDFVLRSLSTRQMHEAMAHGASLDQAMAGALEQLRRDFKADIGIVAVDRAGHPVAQHLSRDMPHAFFRDDAPVTSRMRVA